MLRKPGSPRRQDFRLPHRIRIPKWAVHRGRKVHNFAGLNPRTTALLVLDLQNAFLGGSGDFVEAFGRPIVPRVNRLASTLRKAGGLVVFIRMTFTDEELQRIPWRHEAGPSIIAFRRTLRPGHPAHEIYPGLKVEPGDLVIDKSRQSAMPPASSAPSGGWTIVSVSYG